MRRVELSSLHERMKAAAGSMTFRALAEVTGQNAETVRRYMQGQAPSVEFLAALCRRFDLSAQWLISGRGPMKNADARAHALREANPSELLSAIAEALERLTERVDRIELFVQRLEARLRHHGAADRSPGGASGPEEARAHTPHPTHASPSVARGASRDDGPDPGAGRVRFVADALAQRPPADAR
ncbi:MAG TPA: hypothetical protein DEB06_04815 [Phycisphaerales bacterium]|nr:hypothetical protein [Phycisphaerales bacterium]